MSKGTWVTVGLIGGFAVFIFGMVLIPAGWAFLGATIAISCLFALLCAFAICIGKAIDEGTL